MTKRVDNHGVPTQGEGTLGTQRGFAVPLSSTISSVVIAQTASLTVLNNLITKIFQVRDKLQACTQPAWI